MTDFKPTGYLQISATSYPPCVNCGKDDNLGVIVKVIGQPGYHLCPECFGGALRDETLSLVWLAVSVTIPKGWQCPLCGVVYAPGVKSCECENVRVFMQGNYAAHLSDAERAKLWERLMASQ